MSKTYSREMLNSAHDTLKLLNKKIAEHPHRFRVMDKADFDARIKWCDENMLGSWYPVNLAEIYTILIKEEKDAMLFKLVWGC